jgi:hypothetical protein
MVAGAATRHVFYVALHRRPTPPLPNPKAGSPVKRWRSGFPSNFKIHASKNWQVARDFTVREHHQVIGLST